MHIFSVLLVLVMGLPLSALATIYHLDPHNVQGFGCSNGNAGTLTSPKCTLDAGLQTSLQPGDIVYYRAGSHSGINAQDTFLPSGTSESQRITFAGYTGETVYLTQNGAGIIHFYTLGGATGGGLAYITLDNFIIDAQKVIDTPVSLSGAVTGGPTNPTSNMHHITLQNSTVRNGIGDGVRGACDNCQYLNLIVHNHGDSERQHGFYSAGQNVIFDGIVAYNNSGAGIQFQDHTCSEGAPPLGTCHYTDNMVIRNSRFFNNGIGPTNPGLESIVFSHGYNGQIYNNIVGPNVGAGISSTIHSIGVQILNNTIVGSANGITLFGTNGWPGTVNPVVKGNILYGNGQDYAQYDPFGTPPGMVWENNLQGTDPQFAATSGSQEYQLTLGSPARNAFAAPCPVATDYLNQSARPQGSGCDQGAREYVEGGGVPPNGNPIYLSAGDHGDAPSNGDGSVQSCIDAENPATPKATWAGACVCMTVPGKKMIVRGGTYVTTMDTLSCPLAAGTVALPTTVEAAPAEVPVFQLPSGQTVLLNLRGANDHHLLFKGLTLDAMNRTNSNVVQIAAPGNNITFEDVIMRQATNSCGFMADVSIIELRSDPTLTTTRGRIEQCGLDGLKTGGTVGQLWVIGIAISNVGEKGINAGATSGTVNTLFVNRAAIHHTGTAGAGHAGIEIAAGSGAVVQNTLLYRNRVGVRVRSGAANARIDHVTAATSNGVGIQCDSGATSIKIRHNLVFLNGTAGITNNCGAPAAPNWTTDPLSFTNAPGDDYTLLPTSTAINTVPTLPEVTGSYLPGVDRPQGIASDPGAYEQDAPLAPPDPLTERRVGVHTPSFFQ